jgi:hypothetical protein
MIWAPPGWIERHYPVPDAVLEREAKWIPGALLRVVPEWAQAMGYDPRELRDARLIASSSDGTGEPFVFTVGEQWEWSTDPGGLFDHTDRALGYVYAVDRDAGTVRVADGEPYTIEDAGWQIEDPDLFFDHQFPHLLYHCAVLRGAQPPIGECWPG